MGERRNLYQKSISSKRSKTDTAAVILEFVLGILTPVTLMVAFTVPWFFAFDYRARLNSALASYVYSSNQGDIQSLPQSAASICAVLEQEGVGCGLFKLNLKLTNVEATAAPIGCLRRVEAMEIAQPIGISDALALDELNPANLKYGTFPAFAAPALCKWQLLINITPQPSASFSPFRYVAPQVNAFTQLYGWKWGIDEWATQSSFSTTCPCS